MGFGQVGDDPGQSGLTRPRGAAQDDGGE